MTSRETLQNYRSHLSECKVQDMGEGVVGHDTLPSHIIHLCADNLACFDAASAHGTNMQHISRSHLHVSRESCWTVDVARHPSTFLRFTPRSVLL